MKRDAGVKCCLFTIKKTAFHSSVSLHFRATNEHYGFSFSSFIHEKLKWSTLKPLIFESYWGSSLVQFSKFNNFLWVCWFLCKNLSNFVYPVWKLQNLYCHNVQMRNSKLSQDKLISASKLKFNFNKSTHRFSAVPARILPEILLYVDILLYHKRLKLLFVSSLLHDTTLDFLIPNKKA